VGEAKQPRIIDYGESTYRDDFWAKGREYEDLAERIALQRLLPPRGGRILEIGAGFGRLAPLYQGYDEIVLLDYSEALLQDARKVWGDAKTRYAAANWYELPFADGAFDAIVTVRVLHHAEDLPALMREIARVLAPGGVYALEFANKRNLKAIARYVLRRQAWNPFSLEPVEFHPLHWDFHPKWMRNLLRSLGLSVEQTLTVSHFRAQLKTPHSGPRSCLGRRLAAMDWPLLPVDAKRLHESARRGQSRLSRRPPALSLPALRRNPDTRAGWPRLLLRAAVSHSGRRHPVQVPQMTVG